MVFECERTHVCDVAGCAWCGGGVCVYFVHAGGEMDHECVCVYVMGGGGGG